MAADGEILRLTLEYTILGSSVPNNVFHFEIDSGAKTDEDTLDDMFNYALDGWGFEWHNLASEDAELIGGNVDVMNLDGTVLRTLGDFDITTRQGQQAVNVGAAGASGLFVAPTAQPKSRGRKFVPGLVTTAYNDGLFGPATTALLLDLLTNYLATFVFNGTTYNHGVLSTTLLQFLPFLGAATASDVPAYQRRRKPGVGS
jgi:hypothetical protein